MAKKKMTVAQAMALLIEVAECADTDEIEQGMGIEQKDLDEAIRIAREIV